VVWDAELVGGAGQWVLSCFVTHAFDFEGSMIESVDTSFRSFGAKPYPYFIVSKANPLVRFLYRAARDALAHRKIG
jgi:hypothetical protein